MDLRPSWRGLAGMSAVVLISLPMQNHMPDITATERLAYETQAYKARPPVIHASGASPPPVAATQDVPPSLTADGLASMPPPADPSLLGPPLAGTFTAHVDAWDASAAALRMDQREAMRRLLEAGLRWKSTGHCVDPHRPSCTSLQAIRYGTLMQAIDLKRASGCDVKITGGTETGHAGGYYSHRNGFKVDIEHNACIDAYITGKFRYWKTRGDGAALYRPPPDPALAPDAETAEDADIYANEPTHWDILFQSASRP